MRRSWIPLVGLMACLSSRVGSGTVATDGDAPWSLNGARTFLWAPDIDNDGRSGEGMLVVSTEELTCEDLDSGWYDEGSNLLSKGTGLVFLLQYWVDRDRDAHPPAWDGLYLSGYTYDVNNGSEREMAWVAFNEGVLWVGGYYGGGWLRVDEGTDDAFRGEFRTTYWSGSFNAELCDPIGESHDEYGYDTGYYYNK